MVICAFWPLWGFHLRMPEYFIVLIVGNIMGKAGLTSPPIRDIHLVRMTPISDFVALEQIDLCHEWAGNVLGRSYCCKLQTH